MMLYFSSDFFVSFELVPRLPKWINRDGFWTRKILIFQCILLGNFLIMGYKSTLLSTLVPIHYESTIDTLSDLHQSGLPLFIAKDTILHHSFAKDPRQIMKLIYNESIFWKLTGPKSLGMMFKKYLGKFCFTLI